MRTLVINGHPFARSFTAAIATRYAAGISAEAGADQVRLIDLAEAQFDLSPSHLDEIRVRRDGDRSHLDPVVRALIDDVEWAEHLVVVYPQWWGGTPAVLKAFIDRVVLSGVAYRHRSGLLSTKLWSGRTARIIMTMDSPLLWNRLVYRNASETALARATFGFTGVRTIGITRFTPVRFSTPERRARWLDQVTRTAHRDLVRTKRRRARRSTAVQAEAGQLSARAGDLTTAGAARRTTSR